MTKAEDPMRPLKVGATIMVVALLALGWYVWASEEN